MKKIITILVFWISIVSLTSCQETGAPKITSEYNAWTQVNSAQTTSPNNTGSYNNASNSNSNNSENTSNNEEPEIKKSNTGICHPKGWTYYDRTIHFTPYHSMQECLNSWWREPKR